MRKVILSLFVSADGYVVEDSSELMTFMHALPDSEHDEVLFSRLEAVGEHGVGAKTYRQWAEFWPQAGADNAMNRIPKLVFTRRGDVNPSWGPVRVVTGEAAEQLAALKAEEGGDIVVQGGIELVHSLLRQGAFDEIRLWTLPVAAGGGVRVFEDLGRLQHLELVTSTAFSSGVQEVVWRPLPPA